MSNKLGVEHCSCGAQMWNTDDGIWQCTQCSTILKLCTKEEAEALHKRYKEVKE